MLLRWFGQGLLLLRQGILQLLDIQSQIAVPVGICLSKDINIISLVKVYVYMMPGF